MLTYPFGGNDTAEDIGGGAVFDVDDIDDFGCVGSGATIGPVSSCARAITDWIIIFSSSVNPLKSMSGTCGLAEFMEEDCEFVTLGGCTVLGGPGPALWVAGPPGPDPPEEAGNEPGLNWFISWFIGRIVLGKELDNWPIEFNIEFAWFAVLLVFAAKFKDMDDIIFDWSWRRSFWPAPVPCKSWALSSFPIICETKNDGKMGFCCGGVGVRSCVLYPSI